MIRKLSLFLLAICLSIVGSAQINYQDYFQDKSLRLDYYHSGNHESSLYSFDELVEQPYWAGSKVNLIDTFNYGHYMFQVCDQESDQVLYSRGYNTLFNEWQTTDEAKIVSRSFSESLLFPYPKNKVYIKLYERDENLQWKLAFTYEIDPNSFYIREDISKPAKVVDIQINGKAEEKLDVLIIPEGYTKEEMHQFELDCKRAVKAFANCRPFSDHMESFNFRSIEVYSEETGTDYPGKHIWKNTALNSRFYTFGSARYLTSTDNKAIREYASNAPYDQIVILVNDETYGGGGIYNMYTVLTAKATAFDFLLVHEFGHAFGALADEYFDSEVAVNDYHPLHLEPYEANITTMVDFDSKWKHMIKENTPIPTPATVEYYGSVGVFEGGGYVIKGVYRPKQDCTMRSVRFDDFCPVCSNALVELLRFYSE